MQSASFLSSLTVSQKRVLAVRLAAVSVFHQVLKHLLCIRIGSQPLQSASANFMCIEGGPHSWRSCGQPAAPEAGQGSKKRAESALR